MQQNSTPNQPSNPINIPLGQVSLPKPGVLEKRRDYASPQGTTISDLSNEKISIPLSDYSDPELAAANGLVAVGDVIKGGLQIVGIDNETTRAPLTNIAQEIFAGVNQVEYDHLRTKVHIDINSGLMYIIDKGPDGSSYITDVKGSFTVTNYDSTTPAAVEVTFDNKQGGEETITTINHPAIQLGELGALRVIELGMELDEGIYVLMAKVYVDFPKENCPSGQSLKDQIETAVTEVLANSSEIEKLVPTNAEYEIDLEILHGGSRWSFDDIVTTAFRPGLELLEDRCSSCVLE